MGSLRKVAGPVIKALVAGIKRVGMKRAMTASVVITDAWRAAIADGEVTGEEFKDFGRIGRAVMGDVTAKITKDEAATMTRILLVNGLGLSDSEANLLIVTAVKARNEGVDPSELGVKPEDEDPDDVA